MNRITHAQYQTANILLRGVLGKDVNFTVPFIQLLAEYLQFKKIPGKVEEQGHEQD